MPLQDIIEVILVSCSEPYIPSGYIQDMLHIHLMAEQTIKRQKTSLHEFGISMPQKTLNKIDAIKGPYISRAKFILRAVDKALEEEGGPNSK
jgi:hypothetical protein